MGAFTESWSLFFKPRETIPSVLAKASIKDAFLISAVLGAFSGLASSLLLLLLGSMLSPVLGSFVLRAGYMLIPYAIIFAAIAMVVFSFIGSGIMYGIARLFGAPSSTFTQFYYSMSVLSIPVLIINLGLMLIPLIGQFISIILAIYTIYVVIQVYKQLFNFSAVRAFFSYLILPIIALAAALFFSMSFLSFQKPGEAIYQGNIQNSLPSQQYPEGGSGGAQYPGESVSCDSKGVDDIDIIFGTNTGVAYLSLIQRASSRLDDVKVTLNNPYEGVSESVSVPYIDPGKPAMLSFKHVPKSPYNVLFDIAWESPSGAKKGAFSCSGQLLYQ